MDIHTLTIIVALAASASALVILGMSFMGFSAPGVRLWARGSASSALGLILISMRGQLPDFITVVLANLLIAGGYMQTWDGMRAFMGRGSLSGRWFSLVGLLFYGIWFHCFSALSPSLVHRTSASGLCLAFLSLAIAHDLWRGSRRRAARVTAAGYVCNAGVLLLFVALVRAQSPVIYMKSGLATIVLWYWTVIWAFFLTAGMILMVAERLQGELRTLSGLLPICAYCKKVRDDAGYWKQIEVYVRDHSEAVFSHGICPGCEAGMLEELDASASDED